MMLLPTCPRLQPDLYIGSDAVANTTVPTTRRGTYVVRSVTLGNEVITINPTDVGYCTPGTNCAYYIGEPWPWPRAVLEKVARNDSQHADRLPSPSPPPFSSSAV